jgi:hypothetical protein
MEFLDIYGKILRVYSLFVCCLFFDQNQYNKLLGNVRFTFREFGSDRIQYSKLLKNDDIL